MSVTTLDNDLARRLHQGLTADGDTLFTLVGDPAGAVLHNLLRNPALGENHLLVLLKRRDLSEDLLRAVYRHPLCDASHQLKLALVHNPGTPAPLVLALLPHIHLFELLTLLHLPGVTADQKYAAERAIIQRLPVTPLGNKITLARRGTPAVLEALLKEGQPQLVAACLANPHLKVGAVHQFLGGPTATAETISMVARHERWKSQPTLRLALLKNQRTPAVWFTLFLPGLPLAEVKGLLLGKRLAPHQQKLVEEELEKRGGKRRG